mmetsp:Transcript_81094/g.262668  ORF Transcript_81094/g.262668 Transcript_81094/m.262668 type:complete len:234 (+) Transcript_81094:308-1009(+)
MLTQHLFNPFGRPIRLGTSDCTLIVVLVGSLFLEHLGGRRWGRIIRRPTTHCGPSGRSGCVIQESFWNPGVIHEQIPISPAQFSNYGNNCQVKHGLCTVQKKNGARLVSDDMTHEVYKMAGYQATLREDQKLGSDVQVSVHFEACIHSSADKPGKRQRLTKKMPRVNLHGVIWQTIETQEKWHTTTGENLLHPFRLPTSALPSDGKETAPESSKVLLSSEQSIFELVSLEVAG